MVKKKCNIKPSATFTEQLRIWKQVGYKIWENPEAKIPKAPYQVYLDKRAAELKSKGLTGDESIAPINL
jgi:hypothetical protein